MYAIDNEGTLVKASGRAVLDYLNEKYADSRKFGRNTFKLKDSELAALGVRRLDLQPVKLLLYQHELEGGLVIAGDRATLERTAEDINIEFARKSAIHLVDKLQNNKQHRGVEHAGYRISTEAANVNTLNSIHYALVAGQDWPAENVKLKALNIASDVEGRVEVDQATFLGIMRSIGQLMYEANNEAEALEAAIAAADTVEKIREIDIEGGFS